MIDSDLNLSSFIAWLLFLNAVFDFTIAFC